MKILLKTLALLSLLLTSASAYSLQGLNVITITTDDPQDYVEWLAESQPVFQAAQGDNQAAQGICSPSSGGVYTNEHYVWTISPSISAMMSNSDFFMEKDVAKALKKIARKREIVRRDSMYIIKEASIAGVGVTTAQYNLISSTNDISGYAEALSAMEEAAANNGFDDISIALFGHLAGGDRALTVMASIQAPSSERLGAFFDQRLSPWMSKALSEFNVIRTPVMDFMMECTTLSVNG
jgi:hypothetical protein